MTVDRIRPASAADGPALSELAVRSKAHWGYDEGFMTACVPGLTISSSRLLAGPVFVAERGPSGPVGFVALDLQGADGVEVTHLFVDPPAMGTGIGRRLWERAVAAALVAGAPALLVESDPNAEPFYLRLGAQPVGHRPSSAVPDRQLPLLRLVLD
ncbi:MAG: GNAT family N-acetyltransferase [Actinomycetota bacterium]|nr:GNAT family N-acetyltransferase [Acidimicrobiia bacterium]MDQ3293775.1 GNAT family N-acetyltransferase [Actinomycetota bacterium]